MIVALFAGALALPGPAGAGQGSASGGTAAGDGGDERPSSGGLQAATAALRGRAQRVAGVLPGARAGRAVAIQLRGPEAGWETVAETKTADGGTFTAVWRADRAGRYTLRAVRMSGSSGRASARGALTAPVTVYEPGMATLFGPGLFGRHTACRTVLTPTTVGIAHRTLPCGTRVEVFFGGRRVVVPVIDRGPFVAHVTWDLTSGLAASLRFPGRGHVGTMVVGSGSAGPR